MSCHIRILASLIGLVIGVCFTQTAPAQSKSLVWKRWNWSILYPVDRASSIATQALLASLGPSRELPSGQPTSLKLCGGLATNRVGDEFASDQWFSEFAQDIRRKTAKFSRYLLVQSEKLGSFLSAVESDFAGAAERIDCCLAARLEAESRQRELEYWSYYEDCDRWMPGFWVAEDGSQADENRLVLEATYLEDTFALGLRRFMSTACGVILEAGQNTTFAAERAALESLRLAGWQMERANPMVFAALKFTTVIGRLTCRAVEDVGKRCSQFLSRTKTALAVIPIEAIGFVLPD